MRDVIPVELVEALEEYLDRHPQKKDITIMSKCAHRAKVCMGDMPNQIREGTKIGIDYEKALYKMAFEDLLEGRKNI